MATILFIPVDDWDVGARFYGDAMGFLQEKGDFYLPNTPPQVYLNLLIDRDETRELYSRRTDIRFPLFRYCIERNFLSYCQERLERGVRFELACSYPGGYMARIIDPFGNTFEVQCDAWEEDVDGIDPFQWSFYKRY